MTQRSRVGRYVQQVAGYRAFIPAPLPPDPPLALDRELHGVLVHAAESVARLDGVVTTLPDADLFVAMSVRHEAVLSSQIEGTQSSLDDVLTFEVDPTGGELPRDVVEVVNYVRAMNHGIERLQTLPLSLRLIREVHEVLLQNIRGADRRPGEFRTTQNWIAGGFVPLEHAVYVPPPPSELWPALDNLERFLHREPSEHTLVDCGLAHAQFETIHPFLDGNGRVGRLLISLLLYQRHLLHRPVLYLSTFLKANRAEYYDRLTAIRETGDWEGWLRFFLHGVAVTAEAATATARVVVKLAVEHRTLVHARIAGGNGGRFLELLFRNPVINARFVEQRLGVSYATANRLVTAFERIGLLAEVTGGERYRRYRYGSYLHLFEDTTINTALASDARRPPSD
ncbi:MAG: Fic family protein [Thermomicrobiales bacterium]